MDILVGSDSVRETQPVEIWGKIKLFPIGFYKKSNPSDNHSGLLLKYFKIGNDYQSSYYLHSLFTDYLSSCLKIAFVKSNIDIETLGSKEL
jgi:hypothetical protein